VSSLGEIPRSVNRSLDGADGRDAGKLSVHAIGRFRNMTRRFAIAAPVCVAALLAACSEAPPPAPPEPYENTLRLALEEAKPGDVVTVPEGRHAITRSLVLNTNGVTIRGVGMDKSVLAFDGQIAGAEGLLVNASDFTIEDLAVENTKGDAIKINEGRNIVVRRVRTEWTGGPKTENGAYGIYPVQTENTLIEESVAIGASDAGIYVGQSRNVVVRNNRAEQNVAGIEIENTVGADVYDNVATGNTGGILVFNMPDLPQAGHSTRLFRNRIVANNTANFGEPGSAVAGVPAGSGIVVNSNDRIEIFDNDIADNATANVLISSLFSAQYTQDRPRAESFDPYPESIYIYDNRFSGGGTSPGREALAAVRDALFGAGGALPDIVWDGVVATERLVDGELPVELRICVRNGDAQVLNVDGANANAQPRIDTASHDCELAKLPPVTLPGDAVAAS
jgi:parallel beta-helix repeat protein